MGIDGGAGYAGMIEQFLSAYEENQRVLKMAVQKIERQQIEAANA